MSHRALLRLLARPAQKVLILHELIPAPRNRRLRHDVKATALMVVRRSIHISYRGLLVHEGLRGVRRQVLNPLVGITYVNVIPR